MQPVAYSYEAAVHCPACTVARFGREPKNRCAICGEAANTVPYSMAGQHHRFGPVASHDFTPAYWPWPPESAVDREGNTIGAIFPWDDTCEGGEDDHSCVCRLECDTCHGVITSHEHGHLAIDFGDGFESDYCNRCGKSLDKAHADGERIIVEAA